MLKLKLQYFGHQMWRTDSFEIRPWSWERLKEEGEGDNRGWHGWMASPTQWTWVWVNSGSWWWTGRPDVLWFMGSQRVRHDWVTELNWIWTISLLRITLKAGKNRKTKQRYCNTNKIGKNYWAKIDRRSQYMRDVFRMCSSGGWSWESEPYMWKLLGGIESRAVYRGGLL